MSNVVPLLSGWDPWHQAMAEARAIQPGDLARILTEEAANLPAMDEVTAIVDDLAAARQAVWVRRDAEAARDQAIAWAVRLEQQVAEVDRIADQWIRLHDGVKAGMGQLIHDVTRGHRGEPDAA